MSISTKRGDDGKTDLLFGRRVSKTDPRIVACGAIDELNAALGLARVHLKMSALKPWIAAIQDNLIILMGEVATEIEDLKKFREKGFKPVSAAMVDQLSEGVRQLEEDHGVSFKQWAIPGQAGSIGGASLDMARTICRRAEREVVSLDENGLIRNPYILQYLNRLSDLCWLMARLEERDALAAAAPATPAPGPSSPPPPASTP